MYSRMILNIWHRPKACKIKGVKLKMLNNSIELQCVRVEFEMLHEIMTWQQNIPRLKSMVYSNMKNTNFNKLQSIILWRYLSRFNIFQKSVASICPLPWCNGAIFLDYTRTHTPNSSNIFGDLLLDSYSNIYIGFARTTDAVLNWPYLWNE